MRSGKEPSWLKRVLSGFVHSFPTVMMAIPLVVWMILAMIIVTKKEFISNEIGRIVLASIGLTLSVIGSILNGLIERLDLRNTTHGPKLS